MDLERLGVVIRPDLTKDNTDYFIRLAEFRRELRQERLNRRWQMMLAVWAVLVGAIAKQSELNPVLLAALATLALTGTPWWLHANWKRDRLDAEIMHTWQESAARKVTTQYEYKHEIGEFFDHPDNVLQVAVTGALCIGIFVVAFSCG